jgi:hypothetical protein
MARLTALENLEMALQDAALEADPKTTSREVAASFVEVYSSLIQPFRDEWIVEKIATLIAKCRRKNRRSTDLQYQLGFGWMPGISEKATLSVLRRRAVELRKYRHPSLPSVEKAIATMAKYTGKGKGKKQRITWGEVLRREAQKAS